MTEVQEGVVTLDVDWAPDWMIDASADILIRNRVKATWFVTHSSPAVSRLAQNRDLFELGIHPNCLPGSTHGRTDGEVLEHLMKLVPGAVCMRTHSLYQSSPFLFLAARKYGIRIDVSLFLPRTPGLRPHRFQISEDGLWRIPYFWEDDYEMYVDDPIWSAKDDRIRIPGLRVFDFHPVHVALNSNRLDPFERLKQERKLPDWTPEFVKPSVHSGVGTATMFGELAGRVEGRGMWVSELLESQRQDSA